MRHDSSNIFNGGDSMTLVLDTMHDLRNGVLFQTNPLGALREQAIADGTYIESWNTIWQVRSARFEGGWSTEMVIPFKSLRYREAGSQTWGINFRRVIRWKNEWAGVTPMPASFGPSGLAQMQVAADLVGLVTPARSRNVEVKPYVVSSSTTDNTVANPFANQLKANVGGDFKYGLTRSLITDVTINTDFAQIEEDVQQINLTRFNVLFPEKRDFFLEGQGIYAFGGRSLAGRGGGAGTDDQLHRRARPSRHPAPEQRRRHRHRPESDGHRAGDDDVRRRRQLSTLAERDGARLLRARRHAGHHRDRSQLPRAHRLRGRSLRAVGRAPARRAGIRAVGGLYAARGSAPRRGIGSLQPALPEQPGDDQATVAYSDDYEYLPQNFRIAPGVTVPRGGYQNHTTGVSYSLANQRRVAGRLSFASGALYDGTRREAGYSGRVAFIPQFAIEPGVSLAWVDLPYGDFAARLITNRFTYTPTTRLLVSSLLQLNIDANIFSASVRLRWEYRLGSEFFIVYSDGRDVTGPANRLLNRSVAVKATRLVRF